MVPTAEPVEWPEERNPKNTPEAHHLEAARLTPFTADDYYHRGNAHAQLGHAEKALSDFNEALRLRPDFSYALVHRGNCYLGLSDLDRQFETTTRRSG